MDIHKSVKITIETKKKNPETLTFVPDYFNPIQDGQVMGRGQKGAPTSFSLVTSANVRISLQNVLTFIFNPFATRV